MAAGVKFTVSVRDTRQPVLSSYTIVVTPGVTPVTTPVLKSIVATVVTVDNQVPPGTLLPSVVVAPWHTFAAPVILPGVLFTLSKAVV
jgi:hypothetical protein